MKRYFFVTGSINVDLSVKVRRFPEPGETVAGTSFSSSFGGKGANQAVALARLSGDRSDRVLMAGKTGTDAQGVAYRSWLTECGIDTGFVQESGQPTGRALIEIDDSGANRIVVVSGANGDLESEWWKQAFRSFSAVKSPSDAVFLFQLEIPLGVVQTGIADAHAAGALVILDPAPAQALPDELYPSIDYITPNESETFVLTGVRPLDDASAKKAADILLQRGTHGAIVKAGENGSWYFDRTERWHCPAFPVAVKDTTAAGDSFNAGFAWAIAEGMSVSESLRFANAVGGLSTTRVGAQEAMPDISTVQALLRAWPKIVPRRL